jgi:hypothetical protein
MAVREQRIQLAIRKMFLNYHYLALYVSADEAKGAGENVGVEV